MAFEAHVYFLRPVGLPGPVKIGWSRWPNERLATYMKWSPLPLELAATIEGPQQLERRFHALFRHLHLHHEWFREDPELTAAVAQLHRGSFDVSLLPAKGVALMDGGEEAGRDHSEWLRTVGRVRWMVKRGEPVPADVREAITYQLDLSPADRRARRATVRAFVASLDEAA